MSKLSKTVKAGLVTGLCALGVCGLERKYKFSRKLAEFAHSIEAVPFPGTRLYVFLASRHLRTLYAAVADEITSTKHYDRILDLGTGLGYLPIELALRNPKAAIAGIDDSADMIQIAQTNARAHKVGKSVDFATGDATRLPYPGRYFNLVVSVNVLHHWPDPKLVFDEVYHILVPGGEFWICDYRHEIPVEQWEEIRSQLPVHLRIPFAVGPMASAIAAYSEEQMLEMAAQARFENPVLEQRTFALFGQPMPVFNILKLRKPLLSRENDRGPGGVK